MNDRARGKRLEEVLDALEALPAEEHERYLDRACPDPRLRREVLAILAAAPHSTGYLERFVDGLVPPLRLRSDLTGKRIGVYRLTRALGRGGMGVVYEAERADGAFEQRVALKLLTVAMTGTEAHDRFLAERRILARLKHPAIAHIVDGGVTEDGTPWFAMEHVEGVRIDAYCDRQELDIEERLELFLQVCDAVSYAHRRLVVHRDLKPGNILVTDEGEIKLLDFGIAKLLETEETASPVPATRNALRLMTPEYASPEQLRGEPVTVGSDVYQLGLVLYELLTGHRPYVFQRRDIAELVRVICDQPATRPSSSLSRVDLRETPPSTRATSLANLCRRRGTSPARLRRSLRGDLDAVVLRTLRKDPESRYRGADRLALDIRRHLDGMPVTAHTGTWIYRGRKFLARHALAAAATALVLAGGAAMMAYYTSRIRSERDLAQAERDRAHTEAVKSEQVSKFLTSLFESADPREAKGTEITARELLDRGTEQVNRQLAAQPDVQAQMLQVLGKTYSVIGVYDAASDLLSRSLELRRAHSGPEHPDTASVLADLGRLYIRLGEYKRALGVLIEAAQILENEPRGTPELASVISELGAVYPHLGEYEQSRAALERALRLQGRVSGQDSVQAARLLQFLGSLAYETGNLERAEDLGERALAIYERELGADHPWVAGSLRELAKCAVSRNELEDAERMIRRALSIFENAFGRTHESVGMTLNNLGDLFIDLGRNDEAVEIASEALDILRTVFGSNHPDVAYPLATLGDAHLAAGRTGEARDFYRQGVAVRAGSVTAARFDPVLVYLLVGLGHSRLELGDSTLAAESLQDALELWNRAPESEDPRLAASLRYLGRWLAEQGRCAEAAPLLRQAAELPTRGLRPDEVEKLLASCSEGSYEADIVL